MAEGKAVPAVHFVKKGLWVNMQSYFLDLKLWKDKTGKDLADELWVIFSAPLNDVRRRNLFRIVHQRVRKMREAQV